MEFTLWFAFTSFLLLFLPYLLTLIKRKNFIHSKSKLPPGPMSFPIIGNLFLFSKQPNQVHRTMKNLADIYGPIMSLRLGLSTLIIISSSDSAREVLQKHDQSISDRWVIDNPHALGHYEVSLAWLSSSSPLWKHYREILAMNLFSNRSLDRSQAVRHAKNRELMTYFQENAGKPVKVGIATFGIVLNLVANLILSEDVVDLSMNSPQEFRTLISSSLEEMAKPNISDFFPFLRALDLQGRRRSAEGYLTKFYKYFDNIIDRRLNDMSTGGKMNHDFLDYMLSDSKLDRRAIKALLTDLFVGGGESNSITIEWAMAELLRNPTAMSKARAELRNTLGSKQVEESDIAKLPYLQAIVKETMRLYPARPLMLPHKVTKAGIEISGFTLPKNARVMINVWAIGRDPTAWSEPDIFKPERFLDKEIEFRGKNFEFIPFGSGRRACPGMPLAVRMVPLILASMLHEFEWKLPNGMECNDVDLRDKFGSTLSLVTPPSVIPMLAMS
ncbi:hypothetical protein LUZ60_004994 [Juncus effusus]|nr:hypothetical protein LUZ60_004994 [Juncus effusus]